VAGLTNGSRSNEDAILSSTSMDGNNKTNNGGSSSSGSSSSRSSSSSSSENAQRREEHSRGAPESSIWHAAKDPASNDVYYFNALTGTQAPCSAAFVLFYVSFLFILLFALTSNLHLYLFRITVSLHAIVVTVVLVLVS